MVENSSVGDGFETVNYVTISGLMSQILISFYVYNETGLKIL